MLATNAFDNLNICKTVRTTTLRFGIVPLGILRLGLQEYSDNVGFFFGFRWCRFFLVSVGVRFFSVGVGFLFLSVGVGVALAPAHFSFLEQR